MMSEKSINFIEVFFLNHYKDLMHIIPLQVFYLVS